jgi:hypothetical protein
MCTALATNVGTTVHSHQASATFRTELVVKRLQDLRLLICFSTLVIPCRNLTTLEAGDCCTKIAGDLATNTLEDTRWYESRAAWHRTVEGIFGARFVVFGFVDCEFCGGQDVFSHIVIHDA